MDLIESQRTNSSWNFKNPSWTAKKNNTAVQCKIESTNKMKNRSWVCRFPELLLQFYSACGAPMPCAAGSSLDMSVSFRYLTQLYQPISLSSPPLVAKCAKTRGGNSTGGKNSRFCIKKAGKIFPPAAGFKMCKNKGGKNSTGGKNSRIWVDLFWNWHFGSKRP